MAALNRLVGIGKVEREQVEQFVARLSSTKNGAGAQEDTTCTLLFLETLVQ